MMVSGAVSAKLDDLFSLAGDASRAMAVRRLTANRDSETAIRALEEKLVAALDGDVLRGLPNLLPEMGALPLYALRVNNGGRRGTVDYLPRDGREVLVLDRRGQLLFAKRLALREGATFRTRVPSDEELRADVLEPYVRVVQEALEGHLLRTDRRSKAYADASELSRKVASAVGLMFR